MLPFLQPPAPTTKRRIGNEHCGILEVEVRGGLTVGEAATISELLADEQSSFVRGAQIADAIAKEEGITLSEAFAICEGAIAGRTLEPAADAIRLKHAAVIDDLARVFAQTGQRNMEASVTAMIRYRLGQANWSMDDTRQMDRVLFQGLWQLVLDEQEAENLPVSPVTDEELGKQPLETGKPRKRTGAPSSTTSPTPTQVITPEVLSPVS